MESEGFFLRLKIRGGGRQKIKGAFKNFYGGKSLLGEGKSCLGDAPLPSCSRKPGYALSHHTYHFPIHFIIVMLLATTVLSWSNSNTNDVPRVPATKRNNSLTVRRLPRLDPYNDLWICTCSNL